MVKEFDVDRDLYKKLIDDLTKLNAWKIKSNANVTGNDLTSYYISLLAKGEKHQIVIYGPLFEELDPRFVWGKAFYERTQEISQVIKLVNELCKKYTPSLLVAK